MSVVWHHPEPIEHVLVSPEAHEELRGWAPPHVPGIAYTAGYYYGLPMYVGFCPWGCTDGTPHEI